MILDLKYIVWQLRDDLSTPEKETQAYNSIMTWLNNDAAEILSSSQDPITDRQTELMVKCSFIFVSVHGLVYF